MPRVAWRLLVSSLALSGAGVLLGLGLSQVMRDTQPPQLYVEHAGRVPAGEPFELFVSASEPARLRVVYADVAFEEVSQELRVSLPASAGALEVVVEAEDGAGNASAYRAPIVGVPAPAPRLELPGVVTAGDPYTVVGRWTRDAEVVRAELSAAGDAPPVLAFEGGLALLGAVPLGAGETALGYALEVEDAFGRVRRAEGVVRTAPDGRPVEELNLSAATLSVITPEGRELERATMRDAYARTQADRLWRAPFLLPVEGVDTSGFGVPRRYAPGGPVSYHQGADIAAPEGTPVLATNDGVVLVAGMYPIKGGLVVIDHGGGLTSHYFHLASVAVEVGQRAGRGDPVGTVGSTGLSTGPHLHWEMRLEAQATNPLAWVGRVLP